LNFIIELIEAHDHCHRYLQLPFESG
jgi:hypothetical protein